MTEKMFYHVSSTPTENDFEPRIPECRISGEDETIGRICVADSMEGCLTSFPDNFMLERELERVKKYGIPMIYYFFSVPASEIAENHIVPPRFLVEEFGVWDAEETGEHWIVGRRLEFPNQFTISIHDFEIEHVFLPEGRVEKVKNLRYEKNIEDVDREHTYSFWELRDLENFQLFLKQQNVGHVLEIGESDGEEDKAYMMRFVVPAGHDAYPAWERYEAIRFKYMGDRSIPKTFYTKNKIVKPIEEGLI